MSDDTISTTKYLKLASKVRWMRAKLNKMKKDNNKTVEFIDSRFSMLQKLVNDSKGIDEDTKENLIIQLMSANDSIVNSISNDNN